MTEEQKDWLEYGRLKAAWLITKELEPGEERELTQLTWNARKEAHRWLDKGNCEKCRYFDCNHDVCMDCGECNWEPRKEQSNGLGH